MVFSSIQAYLDSSNWQQAPPSNYNQNGEGASANGSGSSNNILRPQLQQQAPSSNGSGGIRPGSMVDRARQANVAIPEAALKCPRCESTNTKFCYFNNYSLTQPRHFCKTCRRYWTRGGALRNVPVGGGCRRNRRSKSISNNNSNSTATSNFSSGNASSTISAILASNYGGLNQESSILSQILGPTYNHFVGDNTKTIDNNNMSLLNYGGFNHIGNSGGGSLMSCVDEWRSTPSLQGGGNLEDSTSNANIPSSNGFYPFASISSALASQFSSVKVEDNPYKWVNVNGNGNGNPSY